MKCDFCGSKHLEVTKYKCIGINLGRPVAKTIKLCVCCDAHTDKTWLAELFDWDEVTTVISK